MNGERRVIVVGNSVAAMVAALTLGENGWRVVLVTPSRRLGGHFGGVMVGDVLFDAGMVLLEFTSFNAEAQADLRTYEPRRRNDVGRFFPLVASTLGRFSAFDAVATPLMRVAGLTLPDMLIANRVESMRALPGEIRNASRQELDDLVGKGRGPLHASGKAHSPTYDALDLATASRANHGPTLHEVLIEPFTRKVTGRSSSEFLARFHRLPWVPLYWPETLRDALAGPVDLPETTFSFPRCGSVALLVQAIERRLKAMSSVEVVEAAPAELDVASGAVTLRLANEVTVTGDRLIWAMDQERLLAISGTPTTDPLDKASIALASMLVATDALHERFSVLLVPENDAWPFRVTMQERPSGPNGPFTRISSEWNAAFLPEDAGARENRVREALVELGVVRDAAAFSKVRVDVMKDALLLPTPATVERWSARRTSLDTRFPGVPRIGPAAPIGATSLNDHVVQGLKVLHDLNDNE